MDKHNSDVTTAATSIAAAAVATVERDTPQSISTTTARASRVVRVGDAVVEVNGERVCSFRGALRQVTYYDCVLLTGCGCVSSCIGSRNAKTVQVTIPDFDTR